MLFEGNRASGSGAAIYVVYPSSNFVLPILNRGCFIQYYAEGTVIDLPPDQWVCVHACTINKTLGICLLYLWVQDTKIEFVDNVANGGGSAIFTNDLHRCQWLNMANTTPDNFIFNPPKGAISPFDLTYVVCFCRNAYICITNIFATHVLMVLLSVFNYINKSTIYRYLLKLNWCMYCMYEI